MTIHRSAEHISPHLEARMEKRKAKDPQEKVQDLLEKNRF